MKRFLVFCMLLLLSAVPVSAEVYAINYASGAVAVDESGAALIPTGKYKRIYALYNDAGAHTGYAAGLETDGLLRYAVMNTAGKLLTGFTYSGVWEAGSGCIICENGIYRYLCAEKTFDNMSYGALKYAGNGRILAVRGNTYDDIADPMYILYSDGTIADTGIRTLNAFNTYSEGLLAVYDDDAQLYGYIDEYGTWAIYPQFDYSGEFRNGLAIVAVDGGYGIIDKTGEFMLAPSNTRLARSDSIFASIRGDTLRVYDAQVSLISTTQLDGASVNLTGDYIILSTADSETILDAYGTQLFTAAAGSHINSVGDDLFTVRNGRWGTQCVTLVDKNGASLCEPCHTIYRLDDERLAYSMADPNGWVTYGIMANDGTFVTDALYESMARVADGLYCADTRTGAVLLDANGGILNTFKGSESIPEPSQP